MALAWLSGYYAETAFGQKGEVFLMTEISPAETVRRVIVNWRIELVSSQSGTVAAWYNSGVLSLIQWTVGEIPPFPEEIPLGNFNDRNILYSELAFPGPGGIFTGSDAIPADGLVGKVDTTIARDPGETSGWLWWVWGLPGTDVPGIEAGFPRLWWRVLVDRDV
jgi:hypothetical protein